MFYSESTNGFYDEAIHGDNILEDVVQKRIEARGLIRANTDS